MKSLIIVFASLLCMQSLSAQELYMPRDVKQAFKNGTRSADGKPGKNYWQNHARYNISITAAPPDRNIRGSETIMYVNNSPDTLKTLAVKLFLNIHKPGAPRNYGATEDYLTDGMKIDAVKLNGAAFNWRQSPAPTTVQPLRLPKSLAPHDSMEISIDWHFEISLLSNREGMIDSTTYFLAYFYPRIAVFDDINGWDRMPFMDSHEFYSDFNDYVVTLNIPKNYIAWGTGTLNNPERLLQPDFLKKYYASFTSDETIHVATKQDLANKKVTAQDDVNSWKFTATNIPDMAFGISDHFVWDAGSVIVDDATKRRASVQAAYNDTAADYRKMVEFGKHALDWFSHNWPGIPYPYEKTTIFHGYAGMEYPMMANDETYENPDFSRFVAEHEIAHTYMPFYMGINETRYGFMDEGWATTFELLIGRADLGTENAEELYKQFRVEGWIYDPSSAEDIPIITPGDAISGPALGNNQYGKASLGYLAIKDLLGDQLFKACLHAYMNRWNGKHPIPWDFFNTFNNIAAQDLNWFWHAWYFTNGYIDFAINTANKTKAGYGISIDNVGGFPAPFDLVVTYDDNSTEKLHQTPALWKSDIKKATIEINTKKKIKNVAIAGGIFMDADESNNQFTVQ